MKKTILTKLYMSTTGAIATLFKAKKKVPIEEEKKKTPLADANNQIISDTYVLGCIRK